MGGVFFLFLLITTVCLDILYKANNVFIFSDTIDSIVFEILKAVSATAFGACVVGVFIDQYQRQIKDEQEYLNLLVEEEGFVSTYYSANDPSFLKYLHDCIENSKTEIYFYGLGLSILAANLDLMEKLANRLNECKTLNINIYLGSATNQGVLCRKSEEECWHRENNISYDINWLERHPAEIRSFMNSNITEEAKLRLSINDLPFCPWLTAIKIDDHSAIHLYGSPDIRGTRSVWIAFNNTGKNGKLSNFTNKIFSYCDATRS